MASAINSDNGVVSGSAGLKSSADSSGVLDLQTNGTTAISISASQVVTYTNQPTYTGGTANGVMYLNGSKAVTTGTALVFDGANLGVGTASPDDITTNYTTVDVRGSVGGGLRLGVAGGNNMAIYASATTSVIEASGSSALQFVTNAAERMRLDSTGNFIIGGTAENGLFTVRNPTVNKVSAGIIATNASGPNYVIDAISAASAGNTPALIRGYNSTSSQVFNLNGSGNISQFGGQITFPATQVASSDANTLDDYEEGTFTPTFSGAGSPTYESATGGWYIKIGKLVQFTLLVSAGNISGNSNQVTVAGLPFTVSNISSNHYPCPSVFVENGINATDSTSGYAMLMNPGDTVIRLWAIFPSTGINYNDVLYNEVNNSAGLSNVRLRITGTYMAAA